MDLPFPVKRGEPITASNMNRTISAVRYAVNKISSTIPRTRAGSDYTPPFEVTASKNTDSDGYRVVINEGWWYGVGYRGTARGCMPTYELDDKGRLSTFFPDINGRHDAFWLPSCRWTLTPQEGEFYVFIGDPNSETGIVEHHPAPYLTMSPNVGEQAMATATCCCIVAIVRFSEQESSESEVTGYKCTVIQMLHNDFTYIAEYPLATHPFSFYRKSWTLNTFKCAAGLVHVRNPALWADRLDLTQTENGGWTEEYGGSIEHSTDHAHFDNFFSVPAAEISVQENASLISLIVTCETDDNTEGGENRGYKITTKWTAGNINNLHHTSQVSSGWLTGNEQLLRVNYYINGSEWVDEERTEFMVQAAGSNMATSWQVQIPVAIVQRYNEESNNEYFFTCSQIAQGCLEATPLMQYSFHKQETAEPATPTEDASGGSTEDSTLKDDSTKGEPATEGATANARVDVARFKLEQTELDRANTITGEEIASE